ncbi:MAG: alpha/beta fold hydrolase [Clostridia bacterium]|nr:alpha/beta fold hydrolase [Clostridia bacterium]
MSNTTSTIKKAAAVAAIPLINLSAAYGVYRYVFYTPNSVQNDDFHLSEIKQMSEMKEELLAMIENSRNLEYEPVSIKSRDGLILNGRFYKGKDDAPLMIGAHGYRGTPIRDFSGGINYYLGQGYNVLLIEQRGHCSSEGHTITFGVKERYDVLAWANYAVERFGTHKKIVLSGISMGAATVLMASALNLPSNVCGIIADCPYTTPASIIAKVCQDMKLPAKALMPAIQEAAMVYGHFSVNAADSSKAVKKAKVPVLLIHGEDDTFVPCDMSREIAEAAPDIVELHTFPGADHGLSFVVDRPRYEEIVSEFINRVTAQ